MKKVPVQKGPIVADVPTMKHMSVQERTREDMQNNAARREGQTMGYVSPKGK